MKTTKLILALLLVGTSLFNQGCKKAEKGDKGDVGPTGAVGASGPEAKTFTYVLNFTTSSNFQTYSGVTGYDVDDVIVTYILNANYGGQDFYVQLPYVFLGAANIYAEVGETSGLIFINTDKADGSAGSPWTGATSLKFKSVLIKSRVMKAHPNLDLSDYNSVKKALNLKD